jgi:hypothetical protein
VRSNHIPSEDLPRPSSAAFSSSVQDFWIASNQLQRVSNHCNTNCSQLKINFLLGCEETGDDIAEPSLRSPSTLRAVGTGDIGEPSLRSPKI